MGYFGLFGGYFAPGMATCIEKINCYMNMVIDRRAAVKTLVIFSLFFSFTFRKINISRDSGRVRSSALDMFYPKDSIFEFWRKNKFFEKNSSKKILAKKNLRFFSRILYGLSRNSESRKSARKNLRFFFTKIFFDDFFSKKYFSFKT